MTERITTQMQANMLLNSLNNDLAQLDNTQNELSTGLAIQQPSDNPFGAGEALLLDGQLAGIQDYTTSINDGLAWTQTSSAALQSIYQMGQAARTLAVEASNGTNNATDLKDMSDQVGQLIDSIKEAADTEYKGMYVFSGTATATEPYAVGPSSPDTYNGNTGTITRAIGPGAASQIAINTNLGAVLGSGGTDGLLLSTLQTIQTDLAGGSTSSLGGQLANLDTNLGQLSSVQADLGATEDQLNIAGTRLQSLQTATSTELASVQDVDMSQASILYSTQQAGYQAALQSGAQLVQNSLLSFLHP